VGGATATWPPAGGGAPASEPVGGGGTPSAREPSAPLSSAACAKARGGTAWAEGANKREERRHGGGCEMSRLCGGGSQPAAGRSGAATKAATRMGPGVTNGADRPGMSLRKRSARLHMATVAWKEELGCSSEETRSGRKRLGCGDRSRRARGAGQSWIRNDWSIWYGCHKQG